jgi:hypothetical protein
MLRKSGGHCRQTIYTSHPMSTARHGRYCTIRTSTSGRPPEVLTSAHPATCQINRHGPVPRAVHWAGRRSLVRWRGADTPRRIVEGPRRRSAPVVEDGSEKAGCRGWVTAWGTRGGGLGPDAAGTCVGATRKETNEAQRAARRTSPRVHTLNNTPMTNGGGGGGRRGFARKRWLQSACHARNPPNRFQPVDFTRNPHKTPICTHPTHTPHTHTRPTPPADACE